MRVPLLSKPGGSGGHGVQGVSVNTSLALPTPDIGATPHIPVQAADTPRFNISVPQLRQPVLKSMPRVDIIDTTRGLRAGLGAIRDLANHFAAKQAKVREEELEEVRKLGYEAGADSAGSPVPNLYKDPEYRKAFDKGIQGGKIFNAEIESTIEFNRRINEYKDNPDGIMSELLPDIAQKYYTDVEDRQVRTKLEGKLKIHASNARLAAEDANRKQEEADTVERLAMNLGHKRDLLLSKVARGLPPSQQEVQEILSGAQAITNINPEAGRKFINQLAHNLEVTHWQGYMAQAQDKEAAFQALAAGNVNWINPLTGEEEPIAFDFSTTQTLMRQTRAELNAAYREIETEQRAIQNDVKALVNAEINGVALDAGQYDMINAKIDRMPPNKRAQFKQQIGFAMNISKQIRAAKNALDQGEIVTGINSLKAQRDTVLGNIDLRSPQGSETFNFLDNLYYKSINSLNKFKKDIQDNPWNYVDFPTDPANAAMQIETAKRASGMSIVPVPDEVINEFDRIITNPEDPNAMVAGLEYLQNFKELLGAENYEVMMEPSIKGVGSFVKKAVYEDVNASDIIATAQRIQLGKNQSELYDKSDLGDINDEIYKMFGRIAPDKDTVNNIRYLAIQYATEAGRSGMFGATNREVKEEDIAQAAVDVSYGDKFVELPNKQVVTLPQGFNSDAALETLSLIQANPASYGMWNFNMDDVIFQSQGNNLQATVQMRGVASVHGDPIIIDKDGNLVGNTGQQPIIRKRQ